MFTIYFKAAWRRLVKQKLFSLINVIGLSTGLASIIALSFIVYQYVTTNSNQREIGQMYYLKTSDPDGRSYMETPYPLLGEIVKSCPEVEAATHIQVWYAPWLKYGDREFQQTTEFVDTAYFRVFQFPFKYGDPATALDKKHSVVLSEEISEKFFGDANPVGKIIEADDSVPLTVTGVLAHVPTNSTIRPTVLLTTALLKDNPGFKSSADWYNSFAVNYIRLKRHTDPRGLDGKINAIVKRDYPPELSGQTLKALPFSQITREGDLVTGLVIKSAAAAMGFILLIMVINLINLNLAITFSRVKEVAIRQMVGGGKGSIVLQFCMENGILVLLSGLLAWGLFAVVLLPLINGLLGSQVGEVEMNFRQNYPLWILLLLLGAVITVIAASFPAWKLARLRVTDAIKGYMTGGIVKGHAAKSVFIILQFTLAIVLISVALMFHRQINFMKSFALGFNEDNVGVVNLGLSYLDPQSSAAHFETILQELQGNPHVRAVSTSDVIPTAYLHNYNGYYDPASEVKISLRQGEIDAGYLKTYGIPLVEGRNFDNALAATDASSVIINEAAQRAFGWKNAVGKQIKAGGDEGTYTVIGVTNDFHFDDLQHRVQPLIQSYTGKASLNNRYLSVRTDPGYLVSVMQGLKKSFSTMPSRRDFAYTVISDKVNDQYGVFEGLLKATGYVALLTVLIAAMGLFGLVAVLARQRDKEIGIRKVLGASPANLMKLLSGKFLVFVALAAVLATPFAWYLTGQWLQRFAYRTTIHGWVFLEAGGLTVLVAVFIMGIQIIRVAVENPVKSLRAE